MANTELFDRMAQKYDTLKRIQLGRLMAKEIRKNLPITKKYSALDFGCGTGLVGLELVQDFRSVLFVDSSQQMIQIVDEKISYNEIKNAETFCIDLEKNSKLTQQVDCIFMTQVLLHIPHPRQLLSQLVQDNLNSGGYLVIVDFDYNEKVCSELVHPGFEQEKLKELVRTLGCSKVESQTFFEADELFMEQKASLFILIAQKESE